ncbi:cell division protein [Natrarchaeobius oligotrophus]|uniref:DNA helicase n=1 Tax=Natrarchaeobius chitinivorans TaxID=1679083 RepID=A0A3N6MZX8_NATCH|nr:cell division protein [Natrarchaeobius chitinivorans]RQH00727.1 cell division protein [Natrarchaeobius chitinivorans]
MAQAGNSELVDAFEQFFRNYYDNAIKQLAQRYPNEQRSLSIDWQDLYRFDPDLADDFLNQPEQLQRYAEEALRLYDLPIDVSLGQAHVRIRNLPETESPEIREIRARDMNSLVQVRGIVRKATDVRPKIEEAAFECQLCGTLTRVPQSSGNFQEPHECQGCERQGPFRVNFDQSEFVDSQKLRIQESPEGLRGGETPQSLDVHVEDDITGEVTPGDNVSATGVLRLEQQSDGQDKSPVFDFYMEGISVEVDEEQFEDMNITDEDKKKIYEISNQDDVYERMVGSIAPSIYGYEQEKLAMIFQLFSGVTKQLPDGSRIRGDLHMLLIGDPGTGKCVRGDTKVTLADGKTVPIRELVESNLDDPKPIDDGWWDEVDLEVPSLQKDGSIAPQRAIKVWKREAPEQMYRIRTSSGRELEVTPSHPLFVDAAGGFQATRAEELDIGDAIAVAAPAIDPHTRSAERVRPDGGITVAAAAGTDRIASLETLEPDDDWVYDLEVEETHNYVSNGVISHNSQMLGYIQNIAPRSVYTSGKGSSSAGLTAAAVRDDFGDGQQWTLEAGALVLADQGIAAVDELDKMRCVTGDTLVHAGNGIKPIRELAHDAVADGSIEELENGRTIRDVDFSVRTMTETGAIVDRPVTAVHQYETPTELIDVTTESGERLRSTPDHPFFVYQNGSIVERDASSLEAGDRTLVPCGTPSIAADGGTATTNPANPGLRDVEPSEIVSVRRDDDHDFDYVYDLTVEGTHNFIANGMVVHNSEDRSAMHEALEQQKISVSKAGINATLKSRCSLLGAANPKYGRFDHYEPISEQIDLEPALISRFDLIFTVTDQPDEEKDRNLAEHILTTNYAGELTTQREQMASLDVSQDEIDEMTETVDPDIDADLLRKYIAFAKQNCHPRMTEEARETIRDFYVDLRSKGTDEDAPIPVTARKLEALVRLSEASARIRLSDTVEQSDAEHVVEIVRSCLQDIGVDPETGEFDADIVEAGTSKSQRDRIKNLKGLIADIEEEYDEGAPVDIVLERAEEVGMDQSKAEHEIEKLKQKGEVYEPSTDALRTT